MMAEAKKQKQWKNCKQIKAQITRVSEWLKQRDELKVQEAAAEKDDDFDALEEITTKLETLDACIKGAVNMDSITQPSATASAPAAAAAPASIPMATAVPVTNAVQTASSESSPPQKGIQSWLDATSNKCFGGSTPKHGQSVTSWRDLSSEEVHTKAPQEPYPHYLPDAINGSPGVFFPKRATLVARSTCKVKTIAVVLKLKDIGNIDGIFGQNGNDFALRITNSGEGFLKQSSPQMAHCVAGSGGDGNDWCYGQPHKLWLNGNNEDCKWDGFPTKPVILVAVKRAGRVDGSDFLYCLSPLRHNRDFVGALGEVIVYDRELEANERVALERYLSRKWNIPLNVPKPAPSEPPQKGIQSWLDATSNKCFGGSTPKHGQSVTSWRDLSSEEVHTKAPQEPYPHYLPDAINGSPGVFFPKRATLVARSTCKVKTIAVVLKLKDIGNIDGIFGQNGNDFALRITNSGEGFLKQSSPQMAHCVAGSGGDGNDWCYGQPHKLWLNGNNEDCKWDGFPTKPVILVAVKRAGRVDGSDFLYCLSPLRHNRDFVGALGEVIVYDRELEANERVALERYLSQKWNIPLK